MPDVFQGRSATLVIDERTVELQHGDEIPSGADKATVDAMRDAGAFTPAPAADALASELSANELANRELGLVADPERDLAPEADLVSTPSDPDAPTLPTDPTDEQVTAFVNDATADQVVAAAGDDKALAQRLLDAEKAGKNRKTAVDGLTKVIEA